MHDHRRFSTADGAGVLEGVVRMRVHEYGELVHDTVLHNMVLNGYLELLAAGESPWPSNLALGDGTTAPDPANESLNNEIYRTFVGDHDPAGRDLLTSTFVSQNEANGQAIRELGFADAADPTNSTQLTHLVMDAADQIDEKHSQMTITIDYALKWRRTSEL